MANKPMVISTGRLTRQSLAGKVVVVTGAGGGIGFEAARSLAWLGAFVVIAEIDKKIGSAAADQLNAEFGSGVCVFIQTDVGNESSVNRLACQVLRKYHKVDALINNATIAPIGPVQGRKIKDWDASYYVNLRGPVLLAQAFLPGMRERNQGIILCVSSVGGANMGAYETLKSAQVELAHTLEAELEETGIIVFTIGPGIVPTATARAGVAAIAGLYGKSADEFFSLYRDQMISVEAAGASFAAAVALADQHRGLELGGIQALNAAGINSGQVITSGASRTLNAAEQIAAESLCRNVRATLAKEFEGWKKRPLFEKQWMLRDFKQVLGMTPDQALDALDQLGLAIKIADSSQMGQSVQAVKKIALYHRHYIQLAKNSVKDPAKLTEWLELMQGWANNAERMANLLS
jgi:NAD(P)-dependent dehydrogenase (short-subunit alcohol dehydrogenase family)